MWLLSFFESSFTLMNSVLWSSILFLFSSYFSLFLFSYLMFFLLVSLHSFGRRDIFSPFFPFTMETIHVVVCGLDTDEVQAALDGPLTQSHYAWKKSYSFAITVGTAVDFVHEDVFSKVCSVIVLCSGCTPPPSLDYYYNISTVAVPDCPKDCVDQLGDAEFFYGVVDIKDLRMKVLSLALAPSHVIYDQLLQYFTPVGELAAQRAFWILDKDCDGLLKVEDIIMWRRLVEKRDFEVGHVDHFFFDHLLPFLEEDSGKSTRSLDSEESERIPPKLQDGITSLQFLSYLLALLKRGDLLEVWATLHAVGTHPNGLPYSWSDVHSVQSPYRLGNTYLSPYGITFLKNVFKRALLCNSSRSGSFSTGTPSSTTVWSFTPGCPWTAIVGLPTENISLDGFIEAWKYMALEQPDTVIIYARFWGYKGSPIQLFVRRNARASRIVSEVVPNCIQVLVVGGKGMGRRSLVTALVGELPNSEGYGETSQPSSTNPFGNKEDENLLFVRTSTRVLPHFSGQSSSEPLTYVFTVLYPTMATSILRNELLNRTIDVVLLCFDHTQPRKSIALITSTLQQVKALGTCKRMPFVIVGTKADLLEEKSYSLPVTEELKKFSIFCKNERLLWPPIIFNSYASPSENTVRVDVMMEFLYHVVRDPDIAVACPKATTLRTVRRAGILTLLSWVTWHSCRRAAKALLQHFSLTDTNSYYQF